MKMSDMLPSNYLKQSDFDEPLIVTVAGLEQKNLARDDDTPEMRWVAYFKEFDKPLVLNSTNIQLMAKACKSEDTDEWIGKEVVIFTDPNVSFAGKVTGGIRIREHRKAQAAPRKPQAIDDDEDSIPF